MWRLQPNPKSTLDAPWDPDLGKGSDLTQFLVFFFSKLVFTQVRTSGPVFNQGITHGDTLRDLRCPDDTQVMLMSIYDTRLTPGIKIQ
jgi:hypothetical protein